MSSKKLKAAGCGCYCCCWDTLVDAEPRDKRSSTCLGWAYEGGYCTLYCVYWAYWAAASLFAFTSGFSYTVVGVSNVCCKLSPGIKASGFFPFLSFSCLANVFWRSSLTRRHTFIISSLDNVDTSSISLGSMSFNVTTRSLIGLSTPYKSAGFAVSSIILVKLMFPFTRFISFISFWYFDAT